LAAHTKRALARCEALIADAVARGASVAAGGRRCAASANGGRGFFFGADRLLSSPVHFKGEELEVVLDLFELDFGDQLKTSGKPVDLPLQVDSLSLPLPR
jgi:hypothetical protein